MNELALFAGAGGGILGGHLLGWRTICAVERDAYAAGVLAQRQNDGCITPFPIWSDITTFDGRPWRGRVDVISGGFPCQDISVAGNGRGIEGERSGLWAEMARIICEVRPRSSSWKTHQHSLLGGLDEYSETWPKWGLMRDGECWERQTWAPLTSESASGLLPTPGASESGPMPELAHEPRMNARNYSKKTGRHCQMTLNRYVQLWPTPCARDYRSPGRSRLERTGGKQGESLNQSVGGQLNPEWVEWLMGWPIGWTGLKPLAMDRFHEWRQQHSPTFQGGKP